MAPVKKNVVCVGAAQSVGLAIAHAVAHAGHRVHILDKQLPSDSAVAAYDESRVRSSVADISDVNSVEIAFRTIFGWMGHVDALVNTAHYGGPRAFVEDISYEEWNRVINTVLSGAFHCVKQVVPSMKQRRSGVIVNFSTCSTRTAVPLRSPYVAAKTGLEGLTRCLARELGPFNIRCNAILPGLIDNERLRAVLERNAEARNVSVQEIEREYLRYVSLGRKIAVHEFADLVLHLLDERASGITGQLIELGGNVEWEDS